VIAMMKHSIIPALVLTGLSASTALPAAAAAGRNAITTEQVAAALGGAGMRISPQQVVLLSNVVATTSAPALRVESMERWGDDRMKVRMNCASQECLPFFVAVNLGKDDLAAGPGQPPLSTARIDPSSYVVRSGSPAVLLLEGDHMHIRVSVICLENGAPGQIIRVATKDHRQTFTAQVATRDVLKGGL
jgi:hypothetical protein